MRLLCSRIIAVTTMTKGIKKRRVGVGTEDDEADESESVSPV
jgi:hypothetical protein